MRVGVNGKKAHHHHQHMNAAESVKSQTVTPKKYHGEIPNVIVLLKPIHPHVPAPLDNVDQTIMLVVHVHLSLEKRKEKSIHMIP